jgi:hypothetical protein
LKNAHFADFSPAGYGTTYPNDGLFFVITHLYQNRIVDNQL